MRTIESLITPVRRRLRVPCLVDRGSDHTSAIFVAGTGRSGTTWVSELINHENEYRFVFEPFKESRVPAAGRFGTRRYLRPDDDDPLLRAAAADILSGRIRDPWTDRFNRRVIAGRRIVKAIRANLLLKWLHVQFGGLPIVLVCRHPCAVVSSYVRHGWYGRVGPFLDQPELLEDHLSPYRSAIEAAGTRLERATVVWCVETLVPLSQFRPGEIHVVFYEHLVSEPGETMDELFRFLGKPEREVPPEKLATKPSMTSRADSAVSSGDADRIRAWHDRLTEREVERILEIVRLFGLDVLYARDPLPNAEQLESLMCESEERPPEHRERAAANDRQ